MLGQFRGDRVVAGDIVIVGIGRESLLLAVVVEEAIVLVGDGLFDRVIIASKVDDTREIEEETFFVFVIGDCVLPAASLLPAVDVSCEALAESQLPDEESENDGVLAMDDRRGGTTGEGCGECLESEKILRIQI
jgi:hypothetical protein